MSAINYGTVTYEESSHTNGFSHEESSSSYSATQRMSRSEDVTPEETYSTHQESNEAPLLPKSLLTEPPPPDASTGNDQPLYSIFTNRQKALIVLMSAIGGFFSPLSGNTYLPALPSISQSLDVSASLMNLTVTVYLIFQGLAPSFYGDLADLFGRRPAYIISFTVYTAANIGLATQKTFAALLILRCLQSSGSGGTYALNNGVISDIVTTGERGKYMGAAQSGIMLGPAIGPIVGGLLDQYLGWRAIFWFLTICGATYLTIFSIAIPETARNVVGNGSLEPPWYGQRLLKEKFRTKSREETNTGKSSKTRFPNPLKSLKIIAEKDCAVILFYNAIIYASWYTVTATLSELLAERYNLNSLQIGLSYFPFGIGAAASIMVNGHILDYNYARVARANGFKVDKKRGDDLAKFPIEQARLNVTWAAIYIGSAAIIGFGWAVQMDVHLAAVLALTFGIAAFLTLVYHSMNVLLVDLYPNSPSTASAANNLTRCLMAAAGSAVIKPMMDAMGIQWAYTAVGLFNIVLSPMIYVSVRYGPKWRDERRLRLAAAKTRVVSQA